MLETLGLVNAKLANKLTFYNLYIFMTHKKI